MHARFSAYAQEPQNDWKRRTKARPNEKAAQKPIGQAGRRRSANDPVASTTRRTEAVSIAHANDRPCPLPILISLITTLSLSRSPAAVTAFCILPAKKRKITGKSAPESRSFPRPARPRWRQTTEATKVTKATIKGSQSHALPPSLKPTLPRALRNRLSAHDEFHVQEKRRPRLQTQGTGATTRCGCGSLDAGCFDSCPGRCTTLQNPGAITRLCWCSGCFIWSSSRNNTRRGTGPDTTTIGSRRDRTSRRPERRAATTRCNKNQTAIDLCRRYRKIGSGRSCGGPRSCCGRTTDSPVNTGDKDTNNKRKDDDYDSRTSRDTITRG